MSADEEQYDTDAEYEGPSKQALLLMVDAAIGQLATVKMVLQAFMPDDGSLAIVRPDVDEDGKIRCRHENTRSLGFGGGAFCLDCEQELGVSPEPDTEQQP